METMTLSVRGLVPVSVRRPHADDATRPGPVVVPDYSWADELARERRAAWRLEVFEATRAYLRARELGASPATLELLHGAMMAPAFSEYFTS